MYREPVTTMNVNILCHKYELRITVTTIMMQIGKGDLEMKAGGYEGVGVRRKKLCYIHETTSQDECKFHV